MKSKNETSIIVVIKSSDEEEYTGRKVQDDRTFMPSIGPPQILQVTWMWLAQSFSVLGCGIIRVETNNPNSQRCWCFCLLNNQLTSTCTNIAVTVLDQDLQKKYDKLSAQNNILISTDCKAKELTLIIDEINLIIASQKMKKKKLLTASLCINDDFF